MFRSLIDFLEKLKGSRRLIPIPTVNDSEHKYIMTLSDNSILTLYCDEQKYQLVYDNKWVPNRRISVYHVYSVLTNSTDENIRKNFENKELFISNIWYVCGRVENRKKAAIQALIDIISYQVKN